MAATHHGNQPAADTSPPASLPAGGHNRIIRWIDYRLPFVSFVEHETTAWRRAPPAR